MSLELVSWPSFAIAAIGAAVIAVVVTALIGIPVRYAAKRRGWSPRFIGRVLRPLRALFVVAGLLLAAQLTFPLRDWLPTLDHGARILIIASLGWLVAGVASFAFEVVIERHPVDVQDNRVARRVRTQVSILRRIVLVIVTIVTIGAVLLTFPGVEAVGASVLASAGLASVVAGLAAQSTLANVFAGLQLAFSDAIRVDDVVIVENEWGRIEEITLTYVVVRIWDDRRLVLPSTHFTSTPFQNWTRRETELLGSVEFDLDWRVRPMKMRAELERIVNDTELWDGRVQVLNVMDAVGDRIRVRVLVSAADSGLLFDLRCLVREELVDWIQREAAAALPVSRVMLVDPVTVVDEPEPEETERHVYEGLFSGSPEAEERAQTFTAAIPIQRPIDSEVLAEYDANDPDDVREQARAR